MSTDERRALAIILALLLFAATARWLERPRPLLTDVPDLDLARLEQQSREQKEGAAPKARASPPAPAAHAPANAASPASGARIDLNRATAAELQTVRGVGPVLATRLVARRDSAGPYRTWDDVDKVAGVGPALLARLREMAELRQ